MMAADAEHAGQRRCGSSVGQSRAEDSKIGVASDCKDGAALASRNSKGCSTSTNLSMRPLAYGSGNLKHTELCRRLINGVRHWLCAANNSRCNVRQSWRRMPDNSRLTGQKVKTPNRLT